MTGVLSLKLRIFQRIAFQGKMEINSKEDNATNVATQCLFRGCPHRARQDGMLGSQSRLEGVRQSLALLGPEDLQLAADTIMASLPL